MMEVRVELRSRNEMYFANGIFVDSKKFIVCKGSIVNLKTDSIVSKVVMKYRNDEEIVDANGCVLKDCEFGSPSIAAQFVTGSSTNGYVAWKVEKISLKNYLACMESED